MTHLSILLVAALSTGVTQTTPSAPATQTPTSVGTNVDGFMIKMYPRLRRFLIAAVAMMPEDGFRLKPSPSARTFAEAVAHVGLSNLAQCRGAAGNPIAQEEAARLKQTEWTKTSLQKLIDDGFSACDPIFEKPGDDRWAQTRATLSVHSWEMYGTLAVYLRMKGLVPPSTEEAQKSKGQGPEPR